MVKHWFPIGLPPLSQPPRASHRRELSSLRKIHYKESAKSPGDDFPMPFKWKLSIDLDEGHPPLGHENDVLLGLCGKLIYIGSYEGEGEVHL
jgi:hypothetical protein